MVCDLSYLEYREEKAHGLTESISDNGVYRTAPATPGLLKIMMIIWAQLSNCTTLEI